MSFIALHRAHHTSLATDQAWLAPEDWSACESAQKLLQQLEQLTQRRDAELAQAFGAAVRALRSKGQH